ncbi:MAG: two-component sensor histidine kinase, partial [Ideonella sp.]|nr:two-component sensor histidine kinase [Ideonella sp.]
MRGGAAVRDLLLVAAGTVGLWVLAGRANLLERYLSVTQRLERWQADELVFVLAGLAVGMMWYALRRWREARRAVRLHQDAEQRVGELLGHNRELAQQLISVQDNERRALARELHDELGQCCS